ncbi:MAG: thrombospondin type 3 repeat-containing protein [Bacteroidales bacterium]
MNAQETEQDSVAVRKDSLREFTLKPVASLSLGVINFYGDVTNSLNLPSIGYYGGELSLSAYLDRNRYYVANFTFMTGKTGGNAYSYSDLLQNLNFETGITAFSFSMEYRFGHLFSPTSLVRPYISLGVESIHFSAKGDLTNEEGMTYYYWSDGTIRDMNQAVSDPSMSQILYRDYQYETDLRLREQSLFGLGDYSQQTLAFPIEVGFHFRIDQRSSISAGVSYHYTLTDMLDNVAYEGTSIRGNKGNDSYLYPHVAFHFDLFKPEPPFTDLFLSGAYDPLMLEDEDNDGIIDWNDRCPFTPARVEVDTSGCPLDGDGDGVPDYLDLEPRTAPGAWVDPDGTTVSEEEFQSRLSVRNNAMKREDVAAYTDAILWEYMLGSTVEIPDKFKPLDTNGDGELSYDELLRSIDRYFDYQLDLSVEELRELNEFFFSQ